MLLQHLSDALSRIEAPEFPRSKLLYDAIRLGLYFAAPDPELELALAAFELVLDLALDKPVPELVSERLRHNVQSLRSSEYASDSPLLLLDSFALGFLTVESFLEFSSIQPMAFSCREDQEHVQSAAARGAHLSTKGSAWALLVAMKPASSQECL